MSKKIKNKLVYLPRSKIEYLIEEWIHDERDRWLLKKRLLDGYSFNVLTQEYQQNNTSKCIEIDQIKRRVYAAEKLLENALNINQ